MKKCVVFFIFFSSVFLFSQEKITDFLQIEGDSIIYNKNLDIEKQRAFKDNLKDKYNDKEFIYIDDLKEPEKVKPSAPIDTGFLKAFIGFMQYIFPFILGLIVVLVILKTFLGSEIGFWNFKKSDKKVAEKLVYEDEDIDETDFDSLLKKAIKEKDYRLATRYYYLSLLKKLSDKKEIEYHKDKTNTDYLFEIKNKEMRNKFSEVSYIYSYVWYGEFPLDSYKFSSVEKKYKSIFKSIR